MIVLTESEVEVERFYQAVIATYRSIREAGGAADVVSVGLDQWAQLQASIATHIVHRAIGDKPLPMMFAGLMLDVDPRCLVPGFDGAIFSNEWKEALWARFFTEAPARQRRSVERYSIVKRA